MWQVTLRSFETDFRKKLYRLHTFKLLLKGFVCQVPDAYSEPRHADGVFDRGSSRTEWLLASD